MKQFTYQPRSLRDVAVRTVQTRDEVDKAPPVEPRDLCTRPGCSHARWAHCDVRRSRETRTVLYYVRSRGEIVWVRWNRAYSGPRLLNYSLAKCKHFTDDQADFPCCSSSSCAVRGCPCNAFVSPYRKARQKTATGKTKRQKAVGQGELFEIVAGVGKE